MNSGHVKYANIYKVVFYYNMRKYAELPLKLIGNAKDEKMLLLLKLYRFTTCMNFIMNHNFENWINYIFVHCQGRLVMKKLI